MLKKKYYDGFTVHDILNKHLDDGHKILELLTAFADADGVDAVPVVRCKDCKYQEKYFHEDRRRKDGGYYIYGCELAEGYSHVCLDDDFCSRAERKEE